MLRYTGHPFVDVGVATITAFPKVNKNRPSDVTEDDLHYVAGELKRYYCEPQFKAVQNFISVVFMNSHFVQSAKSLEQKFEYADQVLFAFERPSELSNPTPCVFFPEYPAAIFAHRQYIPLLNGDNITNFSAAGTAGIPVSGLALLAIHAMPLGCLKCGQLLAFHQLPDPTNKKSGQINRILAKLALAENLRAIHNIGLDSNAAMPGFGGSPRTRYVDGLLKAQQEIIMRESNISHVTGYYFTNYGPKPNLQILRLNNLVADFIHEATQDASGAWNKVARLGWQRPKSSSLDELESENTMMWRNSIYDALFDLPQQSHSFVRRLAAGEDWNLIGIFLRKVMQMEQERIDTYRQLGDNLAQYMLEYEAPSMSFYYRFARADTYQKLRSTIRSAEDNLLKREVTNPLITYDEFILAFEHPSEGYSQWRLARDLIAIRMREAILKNRSVFDMVDLPEPIEAESENGNE